MPTSMLPNVVAAVSDRLIDIAAECSSVHLNVRPRQDEWSAAQKKGGYEWFDHERNDHLLSENIAPFLRELKQGDRVVVHCQGVDASRAGTFVTIIHEIREFHGDNFRLFFPQPPDFWRAFQAPNFWAAFILAIARVREDCPLFCAGDKPTLHFQRIVREHGREPEQLRMLLI